MLTRLKMGLDLDAWMDDAGGDPQMLGDSRPAASDHEMAYGIHTPSVTYPLFENALRGKYGRGLAEHQQAVKAGIVHGSHRRRTARLVLRWSKVQGHWLLRRCHRV